MPVVIHWAFNFMLGVCTARAVRGAPGLHVGRAPWPLLFLTAFEGIFVTPLVTYLFRYWPAWSMFYLFDPAAYPMLDSFIGLLSAAVVAVDFLLMWLGFVCGRTSVTPAHGRWLQWPSIACAGITGLCLAYLGDRMAFAGDYDTFWRGEAPLWLSTPAGWVSLALFGGALCFVLVLRQRFAQRDPVFL